MNVTIFNFGTGEQVVHDGKATPKSIPVGKSITIEDFPDVYYHLVKKEMDRGGPLVILQDGEDVSVELSAVSALLANVDNVDYELLIAAYHRLVPINVADRQPSRGTIRTNLQEAGRLIHAGKALPKDGFKQKVEIKEEADPKELKEELAKNSKKDAVSREDVGKALGLTQSPPKGDDEPKGDVITLPDDAVPGAKAPRKRAAAAAPRKRNSTEPRTKTRGKKSV